jgi:PAS domain-containing protein
MNENNYKQGADDEREGEAFARSLPAKLAPHVSLQGEGSWANLLTLLEVSPDALVLVDAAGRIAQVNSQTEALFGYPRSELEGEALEVLLPERFRAAHVLDRGQYATSPRTPYKYRFFTSGREHVPAHGVFDVFGAPFPCVFSSCSQLKAWAVCGAL